MAPPVVVASVSVGRRQINEPPAGPVVPDEGCENGDAFGPEWRDGRTKRPDDGVGDAKADQIEASEPHELVRRLSRAACVPERPDLVQDIAIGETGAIGEGIGEDRAPADRADQQPEQRKIDSRVRRADDGKFGGPMQRLVEPADRLDASSHGIRTAD